MFRNGMEQNEREQLAALAMPDLCERLAALPVSAPG